VFYPKGRSKSSWRVERSTSATKKSIPAAIGDLIRLNNHVSDASVIASRL